MMISRAMSDQLNKQVMHELQASQSYLAMSCYFDTLSLKNLAKFFRRQSEEEREHALKIVDYLQEVGGAIALEGLVAPPKAFDGVVAAIEAAIEWEQIVTAQINAIMARAESENDYATRSFLWWFIDEQVEEVSSMQHLLEIARMSRENWLQLEAYVHNVMLAKH